VVGASWFTPQLIFNGLTTGLLTGLLAMAMVLVYRSTRVINFAVGNIGLVGAALLPLLVIKYNFPYWLALAVSVLCGTLFAAIVELVVIRRLFTSPRVIVLVATAGVAQLAAGVALSYPEIDERCARYPSPSSAVLDDVFGLRMTGNQLAVWIAGPIVVGALLWVLYRTTFGSTVEAAADNPSLARLSGVNPKYVSTFVWTAAGLLSTVAMILFSTLGGAVGGLDNLGPVTLSRAMIVFVLAGMRSYGLAVVGGAAIGVAEAVLRFNFGGLPGLFDLVGLVLVLAVVYVRRKAEKDDSVFAFSPKVRTRPPGVNDIAWLRRARPVSALLVLGCAAALPLIVTLPSRQLVYTSVLCFAICAMSLSVITGWAGQLSLAQMTFAGFGALFAAAFSRGFQLDVWVVDFEAPAMPFAVSILLATVIVAMLAVCVGLGALRVRGLQLAVITFVFAVASQQYIYKIPVFSDGSSSSVTFRRGTIFGLPLSDQRDYYYLCLLVLVVLLGVISRLRHSGIGRTTIAARDNPDSASGYTVSPTRTKLVAFATAGGIAALGGGLLAGLVQAVPYNEQYFLPSDSLQLIGMVVVGGISSLLGPILGAMWVIGLPTFFPDNELVPLFTSSVGLLLVVMYFPGGFAQVGYLIRDAIDDWAIGRRKAPATSSGERPPVSMLAVRDRPEIPPTSTSEAADALLVEDVFVRFGGNLAVNDVSIRVGDGEIVGLIGTNGAGKSTLMNAIGGYVPASGVVHLFGRQISSLGISARAQLGLGRTFQTALLFPELTVRETIQVALEARGRTPFIATALALPAARRCERTRRSEADELISFLGLGRYADISIADLSTGTRRIVELANLLALDARVMCLDEPTAGLAQRETEKFGPLLVAVRKEISASMLVIEHDMPLIMSMSDRVYCLELGRVIAAGTPDEVRNDELVVASYLGTDARAIDRSDNVRVDEAAPAV